MQSPVEGGWEYDAVMGSLRLGGGYLSRVEHIRSKKFSVGLDGMRGLTEDGYAIPASFEIIKPSSQDGDKRYRVTLRVSPDFARPQYLYGARWPGIDEWTFRIYRSEQQMRSLGMLFTKLTTAQFKPIMVSRVNDWFMPRLLQPMTGDGWLALDARRTLAVEHIKNECPNELASYWIEILSRLEVPVAALCPLCHNFFPRGAEEGWRRICLGCYRGQMPTSYTRAQIDAAAAIEPWLAPIRRPGSDEARATALAEMQFLLRDGLRMGLSYGSEMRDEVIGGDITAAPQHVGSERTFAA